MGGVGCDNMSVVLACFMHRESYGDLVYRCSRDPSTVSRARRFSSMGSSTDYHKITNRERRSSEPPPRITKSPVIPSNLTQSSDNSVVFNGAPPLHEGEGEEEEEGDNDEVCMLPIPSATTL